VFRSNRKGTYDLFVKSSSNLGSDEPLLERYPVLYLLHGSADVPSGWTMTGNANVILDNLLADNKAKPMIVVMPLGHMTPVAATPLALNAPRPSTPPAGQTLMEQYLLTEVIPFIEGKYRVAAGRENRAMAGLSMGGLQTHTIAFKHLDMFSGIGLFSAPGNPLASVESLLTDPKGLNARLNTLFVGVGERDDRYAINKKFVDALTEKQVKHVWRPIENAGHTWPVWRICLSEFVPLLFQNKALTQ
jgi:enterochelin esterase family protein